MHGLAAKARAAGARIAEGVEVTGFESDGSGAVTRVETSAGPIEVEQVVVAVGPWIPQLWRMLGLPERSTSAGRTAASSRGCRCGPTGTSRRAR